MTRHARRATITLVQSICLALGAVSKPAAAQAPPSASAPDPAPPTWAPEQVLPPPPAEPQALTAQPPSPLRASLWQLDATLLGGLYSIDHDDSRRPDQQGYRASGRLQGTRFLGPVVDDGAPRSLQPFLQRAGSLSLSVGGRGFVTRNAFRLQNRTDAALSAGVSCNVYVARFLALTGGLGYGYDTLHDVQLSNRTHSVAASAGLGLRLDDVRFDVAYSFAAATTNGTFVPLRWGSLALGLYIVLARRLTLNFHGSVTPDGGTGGLDLGLYLTRALGLFLGGSGGSVHFLSGVTGSQYGGNAGLSYWVSSAARLSAYYQLSGIHVPSQQAMAESIGYNEIQHAVSLGLTLRF